MVDVVSRERRKHGKISKSSSGVKSSMNRRHAGRGGRAGGGVEGRREEARRGGLLVA